MSQPPIDLSRLRVLVVDDEPDILLSLGALLQHFHAEVTTCDSGMQAYDLINGRQFNLVILDIQMPQVDGWALIKGIRSHPDVLVSGLPVVALTARVKPEDKDKLLAAGYDHYFSKPPDRNTFLACLQDYARR